MRYISAIIVAVACILFPAKSQQPDNEQVRMMIETEGSPYYYPQLFERYMAGDSTLTRDDYRYLYYGYVYRPEYHPLQSIHAQTALLRVFEAAGGDPDILQLDEIIGYGLEVMESDPFSPSNINFLTYAYGMVGDTTNEVINSRRFTEILEVIASSGDGLSDKTPWHVINSTHAKDFLTARGLEISRRMVVTKTVEYIRLKKPDGGVKGYYFDFGRMYLKPPQDLPQTRSQGIKFEHIGPKYRE